MSELHDFRKLVELCIETAECFYGISLESPNISFNLKGRAAGEASFHRGVYTLKFNPEAVRNHWEEMVKNTISHEVAHIVQHKMRDYMSHDLEWKSIDRNLGGNGQRCHNFNLTPAKRKSIIRYKYVLPSGTEVLIGPASFSSIVGCVRPTTLALKFNLTPHLHVV